MTGRDGSGVRLDLLDAVPAQRSAVSASAMATLLIRIRVSLDRPPSNGASYQDNWFEELKQRVPTGR